MNYPLLSDYGQTISSRYGVLYKRGRIQWRALFIIDPDGIVRQLTVNDFPIRRSVHETLRLISVLRSRGKEFKIGQGKF